MLTSSSATALAGERLLCDRPAWGAGGSIDESQRMLNVLEVGIKVPIHRHLKTSETVVCLEGCLDWVFYEEMDDGRRKIRGKKYELRTKKDVG